MVQTLLTIIADLDLSLAAAVSVGQTTATLSTAIDGDGVALPSGKYGFTLDGDNSAKEFIVCDLVGTALTNIQSVSKQGVTSTGFANYHRVGATVTITDWVSFGRMNDNLNGTTGFNSGIPLKYDGQPTLADPTAIPTVQFVLDTASGGTVTFNRQIIEGDAGETIVAGDWVYFNTTDGEWYKTDADDTAKSLNVQIGKAIGAGTDGNPIVGGIFISGTETVGTYVAGTTYYISNTAGELATSAGTNSVVVGVGDADGNLVLRKATPSMVDAQQGGGDFGTPSTTNKFITEDYAISASTLPVVRVYSVTQLTTNTATRFDITNPAGTTFRYTWDGTGTNPDINATTVPTGSSIAIQLTGVSEANRGIFTVTGSGTNYFEITNASGIAEVDKTVGTGFLKVTIPQTWTRPSNLKYVTVELVAGGGGGAGADTDSSPGVGGSGSAGAYSKKLIPVSSLGATETVTIGIGGLFGTSASTPTQGTDGQTSSFGSILSASGGLKGSLTGSTTVAGQTATGGDINIRGGASTPSFLVATQGTIGGFSMLGTPGSSLGGNAGSGYGFGGSGSYEGGSDGAGITSGGDGVVIVTEYYI